jgi:hypothetical protein
MKKSFLIFEREALKDILYANCFPFGNWLPYAFRQSGPVALRPRVSLGFAFIVESLFYAFIIDNFICSVNTFSTNFLLFR